MGSIEYRPEAEAVRPDYSCREFSPDEVAHGVHRRFVGGEWETHGRHQLDYLVGQGLRPQDLLVDIGCGALRAGRHLIDYLEPGNYYGVDANRSLLQAGYDVELTDEQRARVPDGRLRANDRFDVDFGVTFDMAIAQSVFTHVSLNHVRLCLYRLARVMRPGGSFYATFFVRPRTTPLDQVLPSRSGRPFFSEQNVYWYHAEDARWAATAGPWRFEWVGDWGHPAGQKMVRYVRTDRRWPALDNRPVTRGRRWLSRRIAP